MLLSHEYDGISQFPLIFFVHLFKQSVTVRTFQFKMEAKTIVSLRAFVVSDPFFKQPTGY